MGEILANLCTEEMTIHTAISQNSPNKRMQTDADTSVLCVTRWAQSLTHKYTGFGAAEAGARCGHQLSQGKNGHGTGKIS